jgi:methylaspartate mutase sigma subunit
VEKAFLEMGFNRVYPPGVSPRQVIEDLERDLKNSRGPGAGTRE